MQLYVFLCIHRCVERVIALYLMSIITGSGLKEAQ